MRREKSCSQFDFPATDSIETYLRNHEKERVEVFQTSARSPLALRCNAGILPRGDFVGNTLLCAPSRTRYADHADTQNDRDILLRKSWAITLINHGINAKRLLAGRIRDDILATAATKAGFPERVIIEIIRVFNAAPERLPTPAVCRSRAERTELMRERVDRGEATHHPLDRVGVWELSDHHDAAPEGKLKSPSWLQSEIAQRFSAEWTALEEADAEAARPVGELDHLDDVPRRLAGLPVRNGA